MTTTDAHPTEALVERLFGAVLATMDLQSVYLGDRLGYYRALAGAGALTSAEVAARTGTAERYAREWLEQQAVTGILTASAHADAAERRFTLPDGHVEPLTDVLSPNHVVPIARALVGFGKQVDALVDAHRSGGGVSWAQHGADAREGQAAANRPMFLGALGRDHLPAIPDVHAALRGGGRVADIGCGFGWSAIGIALAYPDTTVDGYDLDAPSIEAARRNAVESGVGDRVRFHVADAADVARSIADGSEEPYDVVFAFECIHDLPDPVGVLASMRALAGDGGTVIVMDERVAETFTAPGDEIERLMYGYSVMCCLADGMAHQPSEGDRHGHAARDAARLRRPSRVRGDRGPRRARRLLPLLPAGAELTVVVGTAPARRNVSTRFGEAGDRPRARGVRHATHLCPPQRVGQPGHGRGGHARDRGPRARGDPAHPGRGDRRPPELDPVPAAPVPADAGSRGGRRHRGRLRQDAEGPGRGGRRRADAISWPDLGYANVYRESFETFDRLRADGVVPADVRFQIQYPTPLAPVAAFVVPEDHQRVGPSYERALVADLERLLAALPHDDIAVQWDVAVEIGMLEGGFPLESITEGLAHSVDRVPGDVPVGIHLCYGD